MFSHLVRTLTVVAVGTSFLVGVVACTQPAARKSKKKSDPNGELFEDDYAYEEEEVPEETITITTKDAGTISVPTRPSDGGKPDVIVGAQPCPATFARGDLGVVEIMITSKENAGDVGEWVEIQNNRPCIVNVKGVTVESPRGSSGVDRVTIDQDIIIQPYRTFVVANDADPAINGGLPEPVVTFKTATGTATTDVLKNDGDMITVTAPNGLILDRLSYPDIRQTDGTRPYGISYALPWNCKWDERTDDTNPELVSASHWSLSVGVYGPGGARKGTPNADNTDVSCY